MKHLTLLALVACTALVGCVNFHATQTYYDPDAKTTFTNEVSGTFVMSKSSVERLEVAKRTKTTSALIGAKGADNGADTEALGTIIGAALKAAK